MVKIKIELELTDTTKERLEFELKRWLLEGFKKGGEAKVEVE